MIQSLNRCLLLTLAIALSPMGLVAQGEAPPVEIGQRHVLHSDVLGEERPYWVYLPASYDQEIYQPQDYPVLYLLDGDAHFHSASGVVQFMSSGINGNIQAPEMIVVAIPNTNRTRDLTPTETTLGFDGSEVPASGGGGDDFLRFIRQELFAEIESTYRTQPYRVFVGHSLGGLIALHALLDQPDMFQAHIAIDPSLWWDDQVLVRRAETFFEQPDLRGAVYITMANNAPPEPGEPSLMKQTGEAFYRAMEPARSSVFRPGIRYFEAEDHGSVPLLSLYHGLLHIFEGYKPSMRAVFDDPATLGSHFREASDRLGMDLLPPEPLVNQLGYALLGQDPEKALVLFQMNVANYPGSANAYDSLGDGYAASDQTGLAIENYEKSLELNPDNENARQRLEELRGGLESGS